jgi:glycine cleavage system H lipoate-binding protein
MQKCFISGCFVNSQDYGTNITSSIGWIAKMKLSDTSQLDDLMDETAYNEYVKESEDE